MLLAGVFDLPWWGHVLVVLALTHVTILVVPMTIINTILLQIANETLDTVTSNLDRLDQLRDRLKSNGKQ